MVIKFEIDLNAPDSREMFNLLCKFQGIRVEGERATPTIGVDLASVPEYVHVPQPTMLTQVPPVYTTPPVVQPLQMVTEYVAPPVVAQSSPTVTLQQLAVAASTQLVDTGRRQELIDLLAQLGITTMAQLPVDKYDIFASHLRAKGVKI